MADISSFIRQGWGNLWKQKIIWLFSALPILWQVLTIVPTNDLSDWSWLFFSLAKIFSFILSFVSLIAIPYLVYSFATDRTVDIWDVLSAVLKFAWRFIGCSCLGILVVFPCMFLVIGFFHGKSTQPSQLPSFLVLMFLPLSLFTAIYYFTMFGFFANDCGIRQSLKSAWRLFTAHFSVLATLGIVTLLIFRIYSTASGALAVLIQSNFDLTSLSELDFINPFRASSNSLLVVLLNGVGQIILTPFSDSIFAFAYLKYSHADS